MAAAAIADNGRMKDTQVEALRRQVEEERSVNAKGRVKFSETVKRDIVVLLKGPNWTYPRASRALGLSESTLHRWVAEIAPRLRQAVRDEKSVRPALKRVHIVDDKPLFPTGKSLRLELTSGAVVTGLTTDDLAELLRRLS